jgi:hypothetical protein
MNYSKDISSLRALLNLCGLLFLSPSEGLKILLSPDPPQMPTEGINKEEAENAALKMVSSPTKRALVFSPIYLCVLRDLCS